MHFSFFNSCVSIKVVTGNLTIRNCSFEGENMEDFYSELPSYEEDGSLQDFCVVSYIRFLQEYNEIALLSARKPSLSDYDAVVMY